MPYRDLPRRHAHDPLPMLASALVHGTTWHLFCPDCERHAFPDVIGLLDQYGEDGDVLSRQARCRDCGALMQMAGGAFVDTLQAVGELHRLVVAGGGDWRRALAAAGRPAF